MKARQLRANKYFQLTAWFLIASHLFWGQVVLAQSLPSDTGAVGLVSNVTGQVFLHHSYQPAIAEPLVFKRAVAYGDKVRSGDDSMVGMLIGNETLVVMEEQSELQLLPDADISKVVQLVNGQVCVSTKKDGLPIVLKTTAFSITVEPASIVTVKLTTPTNQSGLAMQESLGQSKPILVSGYSLASQDDLVANTNETMTVNVLEGSASLALNDSGVAHASLVSNDSGVAQISLGARQGVQVIGETISEPFESPDIPWRIQEFQKNPQHTVTPEEAQAQIAGDQQRQADNLVAALFALDPSADFQPTLPPSLIVDDNRIPTTEFNPPVATTTASSPAPPPAPAPPPPPPAPAPPPPPAPAPPPPGPNESGFPASPGNPTVILDGSTLAMDTPFLLATSGSPTIDGPPVILALQNFSGSTSNIPLSSVGSISPSVSSDLLSAFEDPDNPGSLLAGIRTQNTSSEQATILGGIALKNSTVDASVEVAQFDNANVAIGGSILELATSTLNGGDLFTTSGQNTITAGDDFITVDQGTLNALRVSKNRSDISLTINNGGFLTLTNNSNVSIANGFGFEFRDITSDSTFVSVDNSQLEMGLTTDGVLARLSDSFVVNSGGVLEVNNSGEVSVSSIIRGAGTTLSSGTLNGTAIVVNNQSSVMANQAVKLDNLFPATDLILTVNNGGVLSLSNGSNYVDAQLVAASSPLVELVQSSMSTGPGIFIDVNSGSTLEVPNDALVFLDASNLMINGSLVGVTGSNSSVSVVGDLVSLTNGSALTITNGFFVSVLDGGSFSLNGALASFGLGNAGGNTLNITNPNLCAGCTIDNNFVVPILLRPGANPANIIITGDNPFPGGGASSNNVNLGNAAVIEYGGNGNINLQLP